MQRTEFQPFTIQGLASWDKQSCFAISTQGVRHLAPFSWLVVLIAPGSSLETHDRTSKGLDLEAAVELSTAWIWATSVSPPPTDTCFQQQQAWVMWHRSSSGAETLNYLTSPRLCVSYIDETIHHLAYFLDLRSGVIDWVARVIRSSEGKELITDTMWLLSGSFPLSPTDKQSLVRDYK